MADKGQVNRSIMNKCMSIIVIDTVNHLIAAASLVIAPSPFEKTTTCQKMTLQVYDGLDQVTVIQKQNVIMK